MENLKALRYTLPQISLLRFPARSLVREPAPGSSALGTPACLIRNSPPGSAAAASRWDSHGTTDVSGDDICTEQ